MPTLHPVFLDRDSLRRAWPLARLSQPGLTLDRWLAYGRQYLGRGALPKRGMLALSCEQGYLYALATFTRTPASKKPAVLTAQPIAQASLAHAKDPVATLVDALSGLARMLGCTILRLEAGGSPALVAPAQLAALGFVDTQNGFERAVAPNGTCPGHHTGRDTMNLSTIRLELARNHDFPNGSRDRGYEFTAPLTPDGHIDAEAFTKARPRCKVRRFWPGEHDKTGDLHRTRQHTWAFSYAPGDADDEQFYRLEQHVFRPGEYVTIHEPDGRDFTFRVALVRPAPAPAA